MSRGRRAQQFQAFVEDRSTRGADLPEYVELLAVVGALRALPDPTPDPVFVAELRSRLMTEAESVLVAAAAERADTEARLRLVPAPRGVRTRRRRLAAAVSGLALAGVTATVAVASQSALPGDSLYSIKRGIESAHTELTFNRAARGRLLLEQAGTRLDEAQDLSRTHADPSRVSQALTSFTQQAVDGSDLLVSDYQSTGDRASITSVRTFTASSMQRLRLLQSEVPPQSLPSLLQAAQALNQVQQSSVQACTVCNGPLIGQVPGVLAEATAATSDTWQLAAPRTKGSRSHPSGSGPRLPHVGGNLPPASVTNPDPSLAPPTGAPSALDVQHTVEHLTAGLTQAQQQDLASTVTDTTTNLLDAVGAVGNQVAGALGTTVGGIGSLLPTLPPTP